MSEQPKRIGICPFRGDAYCKAVDCKLWNQRSQQCAIWCIPDRLADLDETLQNICDKLGGGAR